VLREFKGGRNSVFNSCWNSWISMCKVMNSDVYLTCTKIYLKYIKDLNVRPKTIKLPVENIGIGQKPHDIGFWQQYFGYNTKGPDNKRKNRQIELENF